MKNIVVTLVIILGAGEIHSSSPALDKTDKTIAQLAQSIGLRKDSFIAYLQQKNITEKVTGGYQRVTLDPHKHLLGDREYLKLELEMGEFHHIASKDWNKMALSPAQIEIKSFYKKKETDQSRTLCTIL